MGQYGMVTTFAVFICLNDTIRLLQLSYDHEKSFESTEYFSKSFHSVNVSAILA